MNIGLFIQEIKFYINWKFRAIVYALITAILILSFILIPFTLFYSFFAISYIFLVFDLVTSGLFNGSEYRERLNAERKYREGVIARNAGKEKIAEDSLTISLRKFRVFDDFSGELKVLEQLEAFYLEQRNFAKAETYIGDQLKIAKKLKKRSQEALMLYKLGNVLKRVKDFERAIKNFQRSQAIYKRINDKEGQGESLIQLGSISGSLGNLENSVAYYNKSLELYEELGNLGKKATILSSLGSMALQKGKWEIAKGYYNHSLEIYREINNEKMVTNISTIMEKLVDTPEL